MNAEDLIALTPGQLKAWKKLVKAVSEFVASGGKFYSNLDTLSGYNGEHVEAIDANCSGDLQADDCGMPYISNPGFCSFADDDAGLFLTDKAKGSIADE